jgi:ribonucleoside-diphosphate reductase alpha chain
LYTINFSDGSVLSCTEYHKFILQNNIRVCAKDLNLKDKLIKYNFPVIEGDIELKNSYTQGIFSGDGFTCKDRKAKYVTFYNEKRNLVKYCSIINKRSSNRNSETYSINVDYDKNFVPNHSYTINSRLNWLAGILDTDGCINGTDGACNISSINENFLRNIKYMLNTLGCNCTFSLNRTEQLRKLPNGHGELKEYQCKNQYRLVINATNIKKLIDLGLKCNRVPLVANPNRDASRFINIVSIIRTNVENTNVYCFNESKNHSGIFNGVITANCGEMPLPAGGSCLLSSINLSEFIVNAFTEKAKFDLEEFKYTVEQAVIALNEVLHEGLSLHPLQEQKDAVNDWRQIGLGIMRTT